MFSVLIPKVKFPTYINIGIVHLETSIPRKHVEYMTLRTIVMYALCTPMADIKVYSEEKYHEERIN